MQLGGEGKDVCRRDLDVMLSAELEHQTYRFIGQHLPQQDRFQDATKEELSLS
jgi:hypothetical protein